MTAWEYKRLSFSSAAHTMDAALERLGNEGWEVCGFALRATGYAVLLKRPKMGLPAPAAPTREMTHA